MFVLPSGFCENSESVNSEMRETLSFKKVGNWFSSVNSEFLTDQEMLCHFLIHSDHVTWKRACKKSAVFLNDRLNYLINSE